MKKPKLTIAILVVGILFASLIISMGISYTSFTKQPQTYHHQKVDSVVVFTTFKGRKEKISVNEFFKQHVK